MRICIYISGCMDAFEPETRTAMLGVIVTKEGGIAK
jgi:hypothetical protein